MSSTGIVNFEDATIQAVEMYATEKLRIGVSSSAAQFAVGGDIEIGGNITVTGNIVQGSTIISGGGSSFNGANTLALTNPTTGLTVDSNAVIAGNVTAGTFIGDGGLLSNISGGGSGIDTTQTLALTNPTTGLTISSNAVVTGNVTSDTVRASNVYINNVRLLASTGLQQVTNVSNSTSNTISITNPTTGLIVDSNVVVGGNVTADYFVGDGSNLTGISGGVDTTQTLALTNATTGLTVSSNAVVTGNVTADYFVGDGSNLTGISSGIDTTQTLALSNVTTGLTVSSNAVVTGNVTAGSFIGDGSQLTGVGIDTTQTLALSNVTTGLTVSSNIEADILKLTTGIYQSDSLVLSKETGSDWVQRGLDIDGKAADDKSGWSVSLSSDGTVVAIGAPFNDATDTDAGHVRVWEWDGSAWSQRGLDIDGEAAGDQSGYSVSLSSDGSVVAIGATNNDGNGANAGHVRVYEWTDSAWSQRGLDIDGEAASDYFGSSVSLSSDGTVVAIGSTTNGGTGTWAGHVQVWEWDGSAWSQRGLDIDGEAAGDRSGCSVSLSSDGTVVAIGAYGNDATDTDAGHVRVWEWDGSAWSQRGLDLDGEALYDNYGYSVSLSSDGSVVAIGATNNDGNGANAGHVRVYEWTDSAWSQRGLDIDGEAVGDKSGWSVSLSSDGTVVAIGAPFNDGNDADAGHVRVWKWGGSAWSQVGLDIDGEVLYDQSAWSVSLSSDGTAVAIGATNNDATGSNAGHVRVYEIPSSTKLEVGYIYGDGSNLTNISGTVDTTQTLALTNATTGLTVSSNAVVTGNLTADYFVGDGSNLTGISGGIDTTQTLALSNATTGLTVSSNIEADILKLTTGMYHSDSLVLSTGTIPGTWNSTQTGLSVTNTNAYGTNDPISISSDGNRIMTGGGMYDFQFAFGMWQNQNVDLFAAGIRINTDMSADGNTYLVVDDVGGGTVIKSYKHNGSSWQSSPDLVATESTNYTLGIETSISGDGNVVALSNTYNNGMTSVFRYSGGSWNLETTGTGRYCSVSNDGNYFVSAVPNTGNLTIYEWGGSSWSARVGSISTGGTGSVMATSITDNGEYVAVSHSGTSDAGDFSIYRYTAAFGMWTSVAQVSGTSSFQFLGSSLSFSPNGDKIAVGSPGTGEVFIYDFDGSSLTLSTTYTGVAAEEFGSAVALSANGANVAIAAKLNDDGGTDTGKVTVYSLGASSTFSKLEADYIHGDGSNLTNISGTVDTTQTLALSNVTTGLTVSSNAVVTGNVTADYFVGDGSNLTGISSGSSSPLIDQYGSGFSNVYSNAVGYTTTDMVTPSAFNYRSPMRTNDDGTIFAMGVPAYNSSAGGVMLYSYVNGAWTMEILDPSSDPAITSSSYVGTSVDVSDNGLTVIASSYIHDSYKGIAFVWRRDVIGGSWTMTKLQPASLVTGDYFGHGTICTNNDGTLIFIGAHKVDVNGAVDHGAVFKYELSGSSWTETEIPPPGSPVQNYSRHGLSVSCNGDGTKLVVGNHNQSYVTVLEWDSNTSTYIASFPNFSSVSVSSSVNISQNPQMSADGNVIVTGGFNNFAGNIGVAGIARWDGSSWVLSKYDGTSVNDNFGFNTSISNDGSYIMIGSFDGNAYSFVWNGSSYTKYTLQDPAGSASFGKVFTVSDNGVTSFALDHTNAIFFQLNRDVYKNLPVSFEVGTSNLYISTETGNVGINTNNPQYELEVNGVLSATHLIGDGSNITSVAVTTLPNSVGLTNSIFNIGAVSKNYMGTLGTGKLNISNVLTYNNEVVLERKITIPQTESSIIPNSNVTAQDSQFGHSVDISADGTRMIVGSPYEANQEGKVQVFDWNGTSWVQVGLDFTGTGTYKYGYSVAISPNGNLIAIGDAYGNQTYGSVYVYEWSNSAWNYLGNVEPSSRTGLMMYGQSIDITNDYYLVASAPQGYNSTYAKTNVGEVYTFEYSGSGTTWNIRGSTLMGSQQDEYCGEKISLSDDGMVLALSGRFGAYVYRWSNSTNDWVLVEGDIYSGNSVFVGDVKLSPDGLTLAVGNAVDNSFAGSCTVYKILDGKTLKISNAIPGGTSSQLGTSLSFNVDGSILAVSSPYYNSSTGRVEFYKFSGTDWEKLNNTLDGPTTSSLFGKSIAITPDASKLIVGVSQYDTPLTNIGAVYVYEIPSSTKLEVDQIYTTANVGIGTNTASFTLEVNGTAAKTGGGSWDTTSDMRLKENIVDADLDKCYNLVKNLKLRRFSWKDEVEGTRDKNVVGWIAQEVEEVIPKAITTVDHKYGIDDVKFLNPDQIYATMYGAIQKLIEDKERLEAKIDELSK